tara:strand:- start:6031 stop:6459 length:429 start_codon:yes stop_codon:yes gene_type:complete
MHPTYLGFQVDWPVFIKQGFSGNGKIWKHGDHFNWLELGVEPSKVATLYDYGRLYHNAELEVQNKVGDRLSEMAGSQLTTLVGLLNSEVKSRTSSTAEFEKKKCKRSTIDDKQRGLIRRFLNNSNWIMDDFYRIRDTILVDK